MFHFLKRIDRRLLFDLSVGLFLTLGTFLLYQQSLVPSVLDGDPGHFQTVLPVLGIPYPPGFPLYVLLGHFWSYLPIGSVAFRINLFSAFFGALTIGALFFTLRRQRLHLLASIGGAFTLALIPPFWQYATFASEYTLHTFIATGLVICLSEWETKQSDHWLWRAMLVLGLGLSNHPTFLLFVPATLIYLVLVGGRALIKKPGTYFRGALLVALPMTMYLYFPLRANQILTPSPSVLPDWTVAEAQGIVAPFYKNTPLGLLQYVTAMAFVKDIAGQWEWNIVTDWGAAILQTLNPLVLIAAFSGLIIMVRRRMKLLVWSAGVLLTFGLIVTQYAYTALSSTVNDLTPFLSKFFLPGFIVIVILVAWGIDALLHWLQSIFERDGNRSRLAMASVLVLIFVLLCVAWQDLYARHSTEWNERSLEITARWKSIQQFAPEKNAALVGHWGDLTPMWYLQNVEGWRHDLITIFPPTTTRVQQWLDAGKPVYLAGSLLEWAPEIPQRYNLTPWGNVIRVTSGAYMPELPVNQSTDWVLSDDHPILRLLGCAQVSEKVRVGESIQVATFWETADSILLEDYLVYLSISSPENDLTKQDYPLVVNWLPSNQLKANQRALSTYRYNIPAQVLPGEYSLRIFVYSIKNTRDLLITGKEASSTSVEIGTVTVLP